MLFKLPVLDHSAAARYVTFGYLYFMQGVPSGFALTALTNYLTGQGLPSTTIGSFVTLVGLPWVVQLVWGPLIDRYRWSVVGHYKHWVVLTQWAALAASLLLLLVRHPAQEPYLLATLFFVHALFASVQDASVDAMAITITPAHERGRVNAFMRGGLLLGISFGAAVLSIVLHRYGYRAAVGLQAGILFFFNLIFFLTRLHKNDPIWPQRPAEGAPQNNRAPNTSMRTLFRRLAAAMVQPRSLQTFLIIAACYFLFALFIRSVNFHLIRELGWADQELSVLTGGWGSAVTLLVVIGGGYFADRIGHTRLQRHTLWVLGAFLILFNAALLMGPPAKPMLQGGLLFWGVADPLYSIAVFPLLMGLCAAHLAGSQFTAYMALINLTDVGGAYLNGWLLQVVPAPYLGLSAGIILLMLALFLFARSRTTVNPPA